MKLLNKAVLLAAVVLASACDNNSLSTDFEYGRWSGNYSVAGLNSYEQQGRAFTYNKPTEAKPEGTEARLDLICYEATDIHLLVTVPRATTASAQILIADSAGVLGVGTVGSSLTESNRLYKVSGDQLELVIRNWALKNDLILADLSGNELYRFSSDGLAETFTEACDWHSRFGEVYPYE